MSDALLQRARDELASGHVARAVIAAHQATKATPEIADAWELLGLALFRQGRHAQAGEAFSRATGLDPQRASAWANLAAALNHSGAAAAAVEAGQRAVALAPTLEALNNLGAALDHAGRATEAAECYRRALAQWPSAVLWNNLGNTLKTAGDIDAAMAAYREAIRLDPALLRAHSNLLLVMHYAQDATAADALAAARTYGQIVTARGRPLPPRTPRPEAPLRVGFLGADFYHHPVGRLLLGPLAARERGAVAWHLYVLNSVRDGHSARLRAAADAWVDAAGLDDEALAARLRDDGIDVLVDLAGHTAGNRLALLARRVAPVQLAWMGFAGTTGVPAIDGVIADATVLPEGSEGHFSEPLIRLPRPYVAYAPPEEAGPCGDPPCLRNGFVTFGAFNNPAKTTPAVLALWARLLQRLPDARILFKARSYSEPAQCEALRARFAGHGIAPGRVLCEGVSFGAEYFASFGRIDLALDPFPFNGLMTTLDTLWMGVPVVTRLAGAGMFGRHGALLAGTLKAPEWVAASDQAYLDAAVRLAQDPSMLLLWRSCLREAMRHSPLCDAAGLAAALNAVFVRCAEAAR